MTIISSFRRHARADMFKEFLAQLAHEMELQEVGEIADGISEAYTPAGPASIALDRNRSFLAARWNHLYNGIPCVSESFFVTPSTKPAQVGLRRWFTCPVDSEQDAMLATPPSWWVTAADLAQPLIRSGVPSFTELACLLASQGTMLTNSIGLSEANAKLSSELAYLQGLAMDQNDDLRRARAALRAKQSPAAWPASSSEETDTAITQPSNSLDDLPTWCAEHEDQIVVLPRARNGAKKSIYKDPDLIFVALELLAGPYRLHRQGLLTKSQWEGILLPTGLRLNGSVGQSTAGNQGAAYFVDWGGRRRMLDFHLGKGGGRDERHCLRIYFTWDAQSERVICGSMPAHLDNSLT